MGESSVLRRSCSRNWLKIDYFQSFLKKPIFWGRGLSIHLEGPSLQCFAVVIRDFLLGKYSLVEVAHPFVYSATFRARKAITLLWRMGFPATPFNMPVNKSRSSK